MSRHIIRLFLLLLIFVLAVPAVAQQGIEPSATTQINPNANILFPPPVYVMRGQVQVYGSANLANMSNYFLEFRPIPADPNATDATNPWFPVTLPSQSVVQDGVLGTWNTMTAPDGMYQLRLSISVQGGGRQFFIVSPLRLENTPSPFAPAQPTVPPVLSLPTVTPSTIIFATLAPTPTAFDATPRVTATRDANVRQGDTTDHAIMGHLLTNETAFIVGISSTGSGWYYIQLPNNQRGWISPTVVQVSGDLRSVPAVQPPPKPATPTPVATATPASSVNLVAGIFYFDPPMITCGQTNNLYLDVANFGTTVSPGAFIAITDRRRADGSIQGSTQGSFGPIQPGQTVKVGPIPLTVSTFHSEDHTIQFMVDNSNLVIETNENDNYREGIYTLQKGGCP